jgi:hypothetical protein
MGTWALLCEKVRKYWIINEAEVFNYFKDPIQIIREAGEDVVAARNLFSRADDPDMVEWAVYYLTAAEKRYDFLLKKYRQEKRVVSEDIKHRNNLSSTN